METTKQKKASRHKGRRPWPRMSHEQLLTDVFQAYYDARRNKRNTASQLRFEMNLEANLVELTRELETGTYQVGRSVCFMVTKPVRREIFAADFRDRVVHHLLYNWLSPLFERTFINDCYSCRKARGTLYGVRRTLHHMRSATRNFSRRAYILKMDIQGYFMAIDRRRLLDILFSTLDRHARRRCDPGGKRWCEAIDYQLVKPLLEKVVMNDPTQGCLVKGSRSEWKGLPPDKSLFHARSGCGLPIGNLTSQLFSNVYLTQFDHWMKRHCRQRGYGRYVDDMMVVGTSAPALARLMRQVEAQLATHYGLRLHPRKRLLQRADRAITVLGMRLHRGTVLPGKRTAHNLRLALAAYARQMGHPGAGSDGETAMSHLPRLNSYFGLLRHCAAERLRQSIGKQAADCPRSPLRLSSNGKKMLAPALPPDDQQP